MHNQINFDINVFKELPYLSFIIDDSEEIIKVNKSVLEKIKSDEKIILGRKFSQVLEPSSLPVFNDAFKKVLANQVVCEISCCLIFKENIMDVQLFLLPISFGVEKSKTILILGNDVTDEKNKEIDLIRFYYVAQNTVNPLQITDVNGNMIYINPAFERASGYTKEELLGKNPNIFSSHRHTNSFWNNMWDTISVGKVWVGEVENKKKNGDSFFTQLLISPILDKNKKVIGYFGVHRDLTEKRQLEKQLIHTQKMESIGTLAAGVAHEVGNPLASISALVQIVQRSTEDNFIKEKLELVKKQIGRISKIIRDLVDFSRPSNYELQLTDINENLKEAIEIVRVGKKAKNIEFNLKPDENLSPMHLVSDQIQQVFVNILINAVDAILEKKQNLKLDFIGEIGVTSTSVDDKVIIKFSDNGIGISEENTTKVFEPFFTSKTDGKGTGLGLWVSYGIIKSFQGEIKVNSKLNQGTVFTIELPRILNY
jgi:PAS domain S-box-containing protein